MDQLKSPCLLLLLLLLLLQAEVSGTVVSVLVENGQPVAPGQTLLIIKQD